MVELPSSSVFVLPQGRQSCVTIRTRVLHSQSGVRKTLAHDLVSMGIGHGFIRRVSTSEVEVLVVLANVSVNISSIAFYFGTKWAVVNEDFTVERNNYTEVHYLHRGIIVYKSTIPDPENRSLDVDIDMISCDGYTVVSDLTR
jgi:hypothetical protein